jgi:hypothetical protein
LFYEQFVIGVSGRNGSSGTFDSVDLLMMYQFSGGFGLGFSYDYTLSGIKNYSSGSYELMLRYDMGGLDIFYIVSNSDDYPYPTNFGEPFNSKNDDFCFIVDADNKNGYYSSSCPRGSGGDDLYNFYLMDDMKDRFNKKKKKALVALKDEDGNPLEGAKISYAKMDDVTVSNGVTVSAGGNGDLLQHFDRPMCDTDELTTGFIL